MAAQDSHFTRVTRAFGSVTSIFRCHGLQYVAPNADSIGGHDVFYWCGFLVLLSGWFLFLYSPQCRRFEKLTGRQQALSLELSSEKKELSRLQQGIGNLKSGDPLAWERAARARLGWLEPGETLDAARLQIDARNASPYLANPRMAPRPGAPNQLPILQRPRVPSIPQAFGPASMLASGSATSRARFADAGALGPVLGSPPAAPPAPVIPRLLPRQPVRPPMRIAPLETSASHAVVYRRPAR